MGWLPPRGLTADAPLTALELPAADDVALVTLDVDTQDALELFELVDVLLGVVELTVLSDVGLTLDVFEILDVEVGCWDVWGEVCFGVDEESARFGVGEFTEGVVDGTDLALVTTVCVLLSLALIFTSDVVPFTGAFTTVFSLIDGLGGTTGRPPDSSVPLCVSRLAVLALSFAAACNLAVVLPSLGAVTRTFVTPALIEDCPPFDLVEALCFLLPCLTLEDCRWDWGTAGAGSVLTAGELTLRLLLLLTLLDLELPESVALLSSGKPLSLDERTRDCSMWNTPGRRAVDGAVPMATMTSSRPSSSPERGELSYKREDR